jgi:hypothetical protein
MLVGNDIYTKAYNLNHNLVWNASAGSAPLTRISLLMILFTKHHRLPQLRCLGNAIAGKFLRKKSADNMAGIAQAS